tara:strand:- start:1956 stop:2924 length:969 start_codon:yes stop_codon:yes gene_type:complete
MHNLKVVFFGCTEFSKKILLNLIKNDIQIVALFTIPEKFDISYSDKKIKNYTFFDLNQICSDFSIPIYIVDKSRRDILSYNKLLKEIKPDVILVMGWYYMVPKRIRKIPRYGAWGIHASLLPKYAGGAPLVWAIINGEKETGVTLFRLEQGVDDGDIIIQRRIKISREDTISTVYEKVTELSNPILLKALQNPDKLKFAKQNKNKIKIYPQRKPEDGQINWKWENKKVKNFIRAQTKPYPGAYTIINGKKVIIYDADIVRLNKSKIHSQTKQENGLVDWKWDNQKIKNFVREKKTLPTSAFTVINDKKVILYDVEIIEKKKK